VLVPAVGVVEHPISRQAPEVARPADPEVAGRVVQSQFEEHAQRRLEVCGRRAMKRLRKCGSGHAPTVVNVVNPVKEVKDPEEG